MYIQMIGMFKVSDGSGQDRTPRGMKSRALLAMLCQTPGHRRPRRWLEQRLWSDRGQEQASGSLRQALTELRKALGPLAVQLTSDRDSVALEGFSTDLSDVAATRDALAAGREFLEGIDILDPAFNLWLLEERARVGAHLTTTVQPGARPVVPFSLRVADLPEGTEAAIARELAAAIARLAAEYLLGEDQNRTGLSGDRLPGGLDLQIEGAWSEDRAYLKVRLVDHENQKTLWSQRLVASRAEQGRGTSTLVFETTEAQLM